MKTEVFKWSRIVIISNFYFKLIFLHLSVIHSVHRGGGCLPQCMLGYHHPPEQTLPWADTPPGADPPGADPLPPGADIPRTRHPPGSRPPGADSGIRSTSGRYASYWNAFLYFKLRHVKRCCYFISYTVPAESGNIHERALTCSYFILQVCTLPQWKGYTYHKKWLTRSYFILQERTLPQWLGYTCFTWR